MVDLTRRRLLGAAGSLALLAAGCGRNEAGRRPESDADVLTALLRHEEAAAAAGLAVAGARTLARQDALHVDALSRALRAAGGRPEPATAAPPADPVAVLARKQEAVFAYFSALPRLAAPDLRVLVMQIAASEAEHITALRLATGRVAVPGPFAGVSGP